MVDYNMLIRPEFIVIALFINALGAILKYRTWLANKMLPLILFAVAFIICAVWGWFTSSYVGGARWVDSLLIAGLIHGMVVTSIAVWGWFTSSYVGGARWVDSLLIAGLIHGMVVTSIAVWGWDTFYGAWKSGLGRKNKKKEVIT